MKRTAFSAIGVILVGSYLFFHWYFYPPLPRYSGEERLPGLHDEVDVFTDDYGVPHIFADNEKDLFLLQGISLPGRGYSN